MTSQLSAICFRATRPPELARFWSRVLGWEPAGGPDDGVALLPPDGKGFRVRFVPGDEAKADQNRAHFDLTSAVPEDQRRTVDRALEAGAVHADVGQGPEARHVVLADPDGNEFCVIPAGNRFLADTAFIGAVACDGTQEVGYFWSRALGWPLVWDQDEETAIQSPDGGTKISWGGPPVAPKTGVNRLYFELALPDGTDAQAEADRLVALGATRGPEDPGDGLALLDPDGNEFTLAGPR